MKIKLHSFFMLFLSSHLMESFFTTIFNFNEFIFVYVVNIGFICDGEIYLLACLLACLLPSFLPSLLNYLLTYLLTYLLKPVRFIIAYSILNKTKVCYSCMQNIKSIINNHNMKILNNTDESEESCNCRNKNSCPLDGKYLTLNIICDAQITLNQLSDKQKS